MIFGDVLIEFDFVVARIGPHFVVNKFKDLNACLGEARRLLDAVEEEFDEAGGIDFLFPPEAQAADALQLAGGVVHDDRTLAAWHVEYASFASAGCSSAARWDLCGRPGIPVSWRSDSQESQQSGAQPSFSSSNFVT